MIYRIITFQWAVKKFQQVLKKKKMNVVKSL